MKKSRRNGLIAIFIVLCCAGYLVSLNFHEIEPGRFYRSAQLNRSELGVLLPMFKIKTVINLRGENPSARWYQDEVAVTSENGVKLITIDMSSREIPHRETVIALLDALKSSEEPILVHCLGGADRSSEASALYERFVMGKTKEQAMDMLSIRYHHLDATRPAKRYFLDLVQSEDWLRHEYNPCSGQYQYYDNSGCRKGTP